MTECKEYCFWPTPTFIRRPKFYGHMPPTPPTLRFYKPAPPKPTTSYFWPTPKLYEPTPPTPLFAELFEGTFTHQRSRYASKIKLKPSYLYLNKGVKIIYTYLNEVPNLYTRILIKTVRFAIVIVVRNWQYKPTDP